MDATHEHWRDVVGYEGSYQVSDHGRVRSVARPIATSFKGAPRIKPVRERILKYTLDRAGYPTVSLYSGGKSTRRQAKVHRLVLEAFVGPAPDGTICCHWNDIKADNRLANLRWDTPSANNHDIVRNGNHAAANKTHCKRGHPFTPENTYVIKLTGSRQCRACVRVMYHLRKG